MGPEWLPELAMLLAGIIALGVAVRFLFTRQVGPAVRVGAAGIGLLVLVSILGYSELLHGPKAPDWWRPPKPPVLYLTPASDSLPNEPDATSSVSLLLGGVLLRLAPSDAYNLSADGQTFLTIDSLRTRLTVTCDVVARRSRAPFGRGQALGARVVGNVIQDRGPGVVLSKPDRHTLVIQEEGEDILRVRYAGRRHVEIRGRFFVGDEADQAIISFTDGIRWPGGRLPPGTSIDLTQQGKGRIDFQRSGLVQIQPSPGRAP